MCGMMMSPPAGAVPARRRLGAVPRVARGGAVRLRRVPDVVPRALGPRVALQAAVDGRAHGGAAVHGVARGGAVGRLGGGLAAQRGRGERGREGEERGLEARKRVIGGAAGIRRAW
jgi:hypothetical protein